MPSTTPNILDWVVVVLAGHLCFLLVTRHCPLRALFLCDAVPLCRLHHPCPPKLTAHPSHLFASGTQQPSWILVQQVSGVVGRWDLWAEAERSREGCVCVNSVCGGRWVRGLGTLAGLLRSVRPAGREWRFPGEVATGATALWVLFCASCVFTVNTDLLSKCYCLPECSQ